MVSSVKKGPGVQLMQLGSTAVCWPGLKKDVAEVELVDEPEDEELEEAEDADEELDLAVESEEERW